MVGWSGLLIVSVALTANDAPWECTAVAWASGMVVGGGGERIVAARPNRPPSVVRITGVVRDLDAEGRRVAVAADWAGVHLFEVGGAVELAMTIPTSDAAVALDLDHETLAIAGASAGASILRLHEGRVDWRIDHDLDAEIVDVQVDGTSVWAASSDGRMWRLRGERISGPFAIPGNGAQPRFVAANDGISVCRGSRLMRLDEGGVISVGRLVHGGDGEWLYGPGGILRRDDSAGGVQEVLLRRDPMVWAIASERDRLALAEGARGVGIWRVDGHRRPLRLGSLRPGGWSSIADTASATPEEAPWETALLPIGGLSLAGRPLSITVQNSIACVAAAERGLRVIDVSNPARPIEVGCYDAADSSVYLNEVLFHQGYLIAGGDIDFDDQMIRIFDVSTASDPVLVSSHPTSGRVRGIDAIGDRIYASGGYQFSGGYPKLWTIDIKEIDYPRLIGAQSGYTSGTYYSAIAVDPAADFALCYFYHVPYRLYSCDVTFPEVCGFSWNLWATGATDMEVAGDILHQASGGFDRGSYRAVQIDHQGFMKVEATLSLAGGEMERLAVKGDRVYGAGNGWLWVLDVSNPRAPELVYEPEAVPGATDVALDDAGFLYVSLAEEGLRIYRIFDPRW